MPFISLHFLPFNILLLILMSFKVMWAQEAERSCVLLRRPSEDNGACHFNEEETHTHRDTQVFAFSNFETKDGEDVVCQQAYQSTNLST